MVQTASIQGSSKVLGVLILYRELVLKIKATISHRIYIIMGNSSKDILIMYLMIDKIRISQITPIRGFISSKISFSRVLMHQLISIIIKYQLISI